MTFFEFAERGVGQAQRYLDQLSEEQGHPVKPKLSSGLALPARDAAAVPDRDVRAGRCSASPSRRAAARSAGWALLTLLGGRAASTWA